MPHALHSAGAALARTAQGSDGSLLHASFVVGVVLALAGLGLQLRPIRSVRLSRGLLCWIAAAGFLLVALLPESARLLTGLIAGGLVVALMVIWGVGALLGYQITIRRDQAEELTSEARLRLKTDARQLERDIRQFEADRDGTDPLRLGRGSFPPPGLNEQEEWQWTRAQDVEREKHRVEWDRRCKDSLQGRIQAMTDELGRYGLLSKDLEHEFRDPCDYWALKETAKELGRVAQQLEAPSRERASCTAAVPRSGVPAPCAEQPRVGPVVKAERHFVKVGRQVLHGKLVPSAR